MFVKIFVDYNWKDIFGLYLLTNIWKIFVNYTTFWKMFLEVFVDYIFWKIFLDYTFWQYLWIKFSEKYLWKYLPITSFEKIFVDYYFWNFFWEYLWIMCLKNISGNICWYLLKRYLSKYLWKYTFWKSESFLICCIPASWHSNSDTHVIQQSIIVTLIVAIAADILVILIVIIVRINRHVFLDEKFELVTTLNIALSLTSLKYNQMDRIDVEFVEGYWGFICSHCLYNSYAKCVTSCHIFALKTLVA